jgi:hypothetical protein
MPSAATPKAAAVEVVRVGSLRAMAAADSAGRGGRHGPRAPLMRA